MPLWLILVLGLVVGALLILAGAYLIKPYWRKRRTRADLGIAVITLSAISLAIFVLQVLDENRAESNASRLQIALQNQAFRLQLELKYDLSHLALPEGTDMRGMYLLQKKLDDASLNGVDLRDAVLTGSSFKHARLSDAHLEGAKLDSTHFTGAVMDGAHLNSADLSSAHLSGSASSPANLECADLRNAVARGASFRYVYWPGAQLGGLEYDSTTVFPDGFPLPKGWRRRCRAAPCKLSPGTMGGVGAMCGSDN